ncbi:sigma-54-dependent Fis family transcriptional regulator [bacterium]|nr:sigma-54-dependent Fis family transcriptional regulator [bacterium]
MVEQIQQIHDESESAHLEVCGRVEKALAWLSGGDQLVLIDSRMDPHYTESILTAAEDLGVPGVIVSHPTDATPGLPAHHHPRRPEAARGHTVYLLPAGLPGLRQLIGAPGAGDAAPADNIAMAPVVASLLGSSMEEYLKVIRRVAGQGTTILLTGETGCGKSMMARLIHETSPRRAEPYLVVDCGALSDHLIESELFGHVRGAFTGADRDRTGKLAAAGTGTIVLDEINSLPLPLQAKLLRAVEDRVFEPVGSNRSESLRARLIAVSNIPLEEEVRAGRFRSDLYYRLNVFEMRLPPLRERRDAIVPLALRLLRAVSPHPESATIAPPALATLLEYSWPGNVRELRNVIERATSLATGPVIRLDDLPAHIRGGPHNGCSRPDTRGGVMPSAGSKTEVLQPPVPALGAVDVGDERAVLVALLQKHRNNRCRAARDLGVSRMTLYKKLHKHGIFVPKSGVGAT